MKLPDLTLTTLQGEAIRLRGEPVARLILVYRDDCGTCNLVLPAIERLSRSLHGKRLLTLGVSQSDADATLDTINEHGLCFPQALDDGLALSRALEVEVVPAFLLVDTAGEVLERTEGLDLPALTQLLLAAARLCGVEEGAIERVLAPFNLPALRAGSASRPLDSRSG